jgi:1-acyl-sn-glycerol-3-phosphate acyltransferase
LPKTIHQAQPALSFIPPDFNLGVYRVIRFLLPLWMRFRLNITQIDIQNIQCLVKLYQQFDTGTVKLLLAFRHPTTDDPFSMADLLWRQVPRAARRMGIPLKMPVHSHFIYDRGIPLWAGNITTWLFPKLGGVPLWRGKADRLGLKTAREILTQGQFPLAIAPEGATNDHSELMGSLEPGVAQMGFWAAEDLQKAKNPAEMLIVPIGIRYSYLQEPWTQIEQTLREIEDSCDLDPTAYPPPGLLEDPKRDVLYGRLLQVGEYLLDTMGTFYQRSYGFTFTEPDPALRNPQRLNARLSQYLDTALQVAECGLGVTAQGSCIDRCRRLEAAAWDRIFRDDLDQLSSVQRGFANWTAEQASLLLWHMRLAERLTVITGDYVLESPTAERFVEILTILWRIVMWLRDKNPDQSPKFGPRRLTISIAEPLSVTQYLPKYQENRRSGRQAIQNLTKDLTLALEQQFKKNSQNT